jgi:MFS family permease
MPAGKPLGLRDQVAATIGAGRRLLNAHLNLAKAEAGEIAGEVGRLIGLVALALGLVFMVGIMLTIGLMLFLGEWLFGSIGWGVLLGTALLIDIAIVAVLLALAVSGRRLTAAFGTAAVIGIVAGLVLGLDVTHRAWVAIAAQVLPNIVAEERVRNVAVLGLAGVGGVLGLIGGFRRGGALGGLIFGAIAGAVVGLVTSAEIAPTIGAAIGVLSGLIAWPILAGLGVMRTGIDSEALKQRFVPDQTIELTKETIEWVRARTPLAPKS